MIKTPKPPYYAVIFTSIRTEIDKGYIEMNDFLMNIAEKEPGFLGQDSCRSGLGIAVSYWKDMDAIQKWQKNLQHKIAKDKGKSEWYSSYITRIALVEKEYGFKK